MRPSSARWWRAPIAARIVDADVIGWAGQDLDDPRGRRIAARSAGSLVPRGLELGDELREIDRHPGGPGTRLREGRTPLVETPVAEPDQSIDVDLRPRGKHDRDRRHERRRDPAPAQQHVDERPTDAAVAVDEGMDRLELRMSDGGLGHRWKVVAVHEVHEVEHQRLDLVLRRRDVAGVSRGRQSATEPVLFATERPGHDPRQFVGHQRSMDGEDVLGRERGPSIAEGDGLLHRDDIGGHGPGAALGRTRIDERAGEVPLAELDALDATRGDRLRAQEERPDRLEAADALVRVELPDRDLGVVDRARRVEAHGRIDPRDRSRHEGAVRDALTPFAATDCAGITFPVAFDPSHVCHSSCEYDALEQDIITKPSKC